ncbi:hypothetical protein BGI41_07150 [Methanobrevibacter sp. 87.7]|uniref:YczE/YyaS/YitT family protein n=1 Tax=Methanobrevibacter sp. 87.7 TaxID=387957 RepID=UPI000B5026CC|nr:DUF6198 family protein [Methanobrevibacter sp. 87.7]OWT32536.1 hypothetical protein BGI41_07150 [Methanobrevibacter sp. 87.7]
MKLKELLIRYAMLVIGVSTMSLGIALSIKGGLGLSPISCIPYVLSKAYPLTVGEFTVIFNVLLVLLQIIILKNFNVKLISEMIVCFIFGYAIDFNLWLISFINPVNYIEQWIICLLGGFVLALGLCVEIKSRTSMLPGDGAVLVISKVYNKEFSKVKPMFDISMVISSVILAFYLLGHLDAVREGTVFAAVFVGPIIKFYNKTFAYKFDEFLIKLSKEA